MGLKALILVGGFGTRLRPLTLSVPKPIVDFANKPIIVHQIEALRDAGVDEVVLAVNYQPERMMSFLEAWSKKLNVKIVASQEMEPMGTAGPLALARKHLDDGSGEPFFVLNSDVTCEYPLADMLAFHKQRGAEATLLVTKVEDPSKYGVVLMDGEGLVDKFVEKPQVFVGDKINAGIYVISPNVLDRIELRPTSIEKEIFPKIAEDDKLFAMVLPGFWMDIGQPRDFQTGLGMYLGSLRNKAPGSLASGEGIKGNVLMDGSAKVGKGCLIGPDVSLGEGVVVEDGVRLSNCTIMAGCTIKSHACVSGSIIGWRSTVGKWARVENMAVLGEDVVIKDELYHNGTIILPHKEIKESNTSPGKIIM